MFRTNRASATPRAGRGFEVLSRLGECLAVEIPGHAREKQSRHEESRDDEPAQPQQRSRTGHRRGRDGFFGAGGCGGDVRHWARPNRARVRFHARIPATGGPRAEPAARRANPSEGAEPPGSTQLRPEGRCNNLINNHVLDIRRPHDGHSSIDPSLWRRQMRRPTRAAMVFPRKRPREVFTKTSEVRALQSRNARTRGRARGKVAARSSRWKGEASDSTRR